MKKRLLVLFLLFIISLLSFSEDKKDLNIGVVYDGDNAEKTFVSELLKKELSNILGSDYNISFPEKKQLSGNFDKIDLEKKLDLLLNDRETDIVIGGGMISSHLLLNKDKLNKASFAPFIFGSISKKIKKENLNYIFSSIDLREEIKGFQTINNFKSLLIIIGDDLAGSVGKEIDDLKKDLNLSSLGIKSEIVIIKSGISDIANVIENYEAVYIAPTRKLTKETRKNLYKYINDKKLLSFSAKGTVDISEGILAGYSYEKNLKKIIRVTALNISSYLEGEKMENLTSQVSQSDTELLLNMRVIEDTGIWPNWDIISSAKLINFEKNNPENAFDLKKIVDIAMEKNPEIKALEKELNISNLEIKKAKTLYKPRIKLNAQGALLDEDRAESLMTPSEYSFKAGASLTQVLYSDDIKMNVNIKKEMYKLKEEELKTKKLNLTLELTETYINVLKAKAYSKIQKNNLDLTKNNLDIAKSRKKSGISGSADIYRWEAELANNISSLMEAILGVQILEKKLKRLAHYDLNMKLNLKELSYLDKTFITSSEILRDLIDNQKNVEILIQYLSKIAYKNAPELSSLKKAENIQNILYKNKKNKRFLPTVALQASYTRNNILGGGTGSESTEFTAIGSIADKATQKTFSDLLGAFGDPDDNDWSVGIGFSIPIYSGGELKQEKEIIKNQLEKIGYQKNATLKGLEQRVATYVLKLVSNSSKITNAEKSAYSAKKALDLVKDAYLKGVVSMSELIETQTTAMSAAQYKETVSYDFLISLMNTERAVGKFYFNSNKDDKSLFLKDLSDFKDEFIKKN